MERPLADLLYLTGLREQDGAALREHAPRIEVWAEGLVALFYETLFRHPDSRALFHEGERPHREATLDRWLRDLAAGEPAEVFWRQQWSVGLIHARRHVPRSFVLAAMSRLQIAVLERCFAELPPDEAARLYGAFKRTTDVVAGLITEGYHQGYRQAVTEVTGMQPALLDRIADLALGPRVARLQQGVEDELFAADPLG